MKIAYYNNPNIGLFFKLNNSVCLAPFSLTKGLKNTIEERMDVKIIQTSILHTDIIGIYTIMNDNGVIVPDLAEEEKKLLKKELNIFESHSKFNAFGNNLVINNKIGLINEEIPKNDIKKYEDVLGIELIPKKIANHKTVGSLMVMNDRGFLVSYLVSEEEKKELEMELNLKGERGTINMGSGFISLGALVNNNSYLVGSSSTGYEIGKLEEALDFIK